MTDLREALLQYQDTIAPWYRRRGVRTAWQIGLAFLLGVLVSQTWGCAHLGVRGTPSDDPTLLEATRTVWHEGLFRNDSPPRVRIVAPEERTCMQETGRPGFKCGLACKGGCVVTPFDVSLVRDEGEPWSETTLAHELVHVSHLRRGIVDPQHRGPEWRPLETCSGADPPTCGQVESANLLLKARGK